jgi:hypothetical protein
MEEGKLTRREGRRGRRGGGTGRGGGLLPETGRQRASPYMLGAGALSPLCRCCFRPLPLLMCLGFCLFPGWLCLGRCGLRLCCAAEERILRCGQEGQGGWTGWMRRS